jgi:thymidylate synthase (FAD)
MRILDKGEIGLVDSMGSDHRIAEAAWVSYGKQEQDKPIEPVINYMMKHKHGSPFEHVVFTFYVKAPIFVIREWVRHRIASLNEISGRYVTFEPEFYIPANIRVKGSTNKQGSILPDEEFLKEKVWTNIEGFDKYIKGLLEENNRNTYERYLWLLEEGVANELARMVLPVNLYTQLYWTINLRSLFNFMSLRSDSNAQWEIQQYSHALEEIVREKVPVAFAAWEENGRIAP